HPARQGKPADAVGEYCGGLHRARGRSFPPSKLHGVKPKSAEHRRKTRAMAASRSAPLRGPRFWGNTSNRTGRAVPRFFGLPESAGYARRSKPRSSKESPASIVNESAQEDCWASRERTGELRTGSTECATGPCERMLAGSGRVQRLR